MIGRLLRLFRRTKVHVPGSSRVAEGEARKVDIGDPMAGGRQVLLCRVEGRLHAIDNQCPHEQGGRLEAGPLVDGCWARCPLHNYLYSPLNGRERNGASKSGRTYKVTEKNGEAELLL